MIFLIQETIRLNGEIAGKYFFAPLVFNWKAEGQGRTSLSPDFGSRKIIDKLKENIKSIQARLKQMDIKRLLKTEKQIILQGPPGTGKTYTAKKIAKQLVGEDNEDQIKLIQFHPSYSYEDFVRGVISKTTDGQIEYVTEDQVLCRIAKDAKKA